MTQFDKMRLLNGERIQMQSRQGRAGTGVVVVDVAADPDTVYKTLIDFQRYPELLSTVRMADIKTQSDDEVKISYALSRFRLRVNVVHKLDPICRKIEFSLDTATPNLVLRKADGFWFAESIPER